MPKPAQRRAAFEAMLKRVASQVRRRALRRADRFATADDVLALVQAAGFCPTAVTVADLAGAFAVGWRDTGCVTALCHPAAARDPDGATRLVPVWKLVEGGKMRELASTARVELAGSSVPEDIAERLRGEWCTELELARRAVRDMARLRHPRTATLSDCRLFLEQRENPWSLAEYTGLEAAVFTADRWCWTGAWIPARVRNAAGFEMETDTIEADRLYELLGGGLFGRRFWLRTRRCSTGQSAVVPVPMGGCILPALRTRLEGAGCGMWAVSA